MSNGSNYEALQNYLSRPYFAGGRFTLDFDEIERILGKPLPRAARANRAWWSNRRCSSQAGVWLGADCRVISVDFARDQVTFHRPADYRLPGPDGTPGWDRFRIRSLRRHLRLTQAAFAQLIGTVQQTVSDWETGRLLPSDDISRRLTVIARQWKFPGAGLSQQSKIPRNWGKL